MNGIQIAFLEILFITYNCVYSFGFFSIAMIGPPMVTVVHSNKSITVKLQAPRSPYRRKRGSKIPMTNYYDLLYQVFIINNLLDEVRVYSDMNPSPLNSQKSVGTPYLFCC